MTGKDLKRLILGAITLVVVALLGSSLLSSLSEPQITSRIELYQTDLLLHATELGGTGPEAAKWSTARKAILGENPLNTALEQYQEVRQTAEKSLKRFQARLQQVSQSSPIGTGNSTGSIVSSPDSPNSVQQLQSSIQQQQESINQLDLRIGILQAEQKKLKEAVKTWTPLVDRSTSKTNANSTKDTAAVLLGLWGDPPRLLPDAETQLQQHLEGWFRYKALARLYQLQQRSDALAPLQATEQQVAKDTLVKLAIVGPLSTLAGIIGFGLLLVLIGQWFLRGKQSLLADSQGLAWDVPWNWEVVWQVLIVGFFFIGQLVIPVLTGALGSSFATFGSRAKAAYTLTYYLLMAGSAGLVLYLSIKPYFPLPEDWFRLTGKRNWFVWGVGGYLAALPLMLGISLLNQQIWQGQGGSNPLLQTVLEEGDKVALAMFLFTAAVAAPLFEELLFRGFLLPSLTRYFPAWGAIALSSLLFAIAHLSLSEVLPLFVLGSVLGFVYTKSRGLLAPMLLHSLWNSVTMIGLFILGSGMK